MRRHVGYLLGMSLVVVLASACGDGGPSGDAAAHFDRSDHDPLAAMDRICEEHRPVAAGDNPVALVTGAGTAGLVAERHRLAGLDPGPWDDTDPDREVASCSYGYLGGPPGVAPADRVTTTFVCPNGRIAVGTEELPTYFVDGHGNASLDLIPPETPLPIPGGPAVAVPPPAPPHPACED